MKKPFASILFPSEQSEAPQMDHQHPLSYFHTRSHFLDNVMTQINIKSHLNAPDLQRNVHVEYLTRAYDRMRSKVLKDQKESQRYISPSEYSTILDSKKTQEQETLVRQQTLMQHKRNQMYDTYFQNYVEEPEPEEQPEVEILPARVQPKLSQKDQHRVKSRQREMEMLDEEINNIRLELEIETQKTRNSNPSHCCTNVRLMERMSSSILSSYMVHFDEVFDLLIDEVLEEEVRHLNSLQSDYRQSGQVLTENRRLDPQQRRLDPQQRRLVDLVRSLDDLCDD